MLLDKQEINSLAERMKADEDVPYYVNITDAATSDQSLLKGLFRETLLIPQNRNIEN